MPFTKANAAECGRRGGQATGQKAGKSDPILADLRWVWKHEDERRDTTPGRKQARALLKESPSKFLANYRALKRDERAAAPSVGTAHNDDKVPATDQGLEQCLELCEQWLKEHAHVSVDEVLRACAEESRRQPALAGDAVPPREGESVDPGRHEGVVAA
jgi:hypothetical protein